MIIYTNRKKKDDSKNHGTIIMKIGGGGQPEPPIENTYFFVGNLTSTTQSFRIKSNRNTLSFFTNPIEYSYNQIDWQELGLPTTDGLLVEIEGDSKVYLRSENQAWSSQNQGDVAIEDWSSNNSFEVGGNILSLIFGSDFRTHIDNPTLTMYCFHHLFFGLTSIYKYGLKYADKLVMPNSTSYYGFAGMFAWNVNLKTAPALPATTLKNYCYTDMFSECTSLEAAPALPATTLANYCYRGMFNGCTSLNNITIYATDISASNCLSYWLQNVSSTGTFTKKSGVTYPTGASGIPEGWTVINV